MYGDPVPNHQILRSTIGDSSHQILIFWLWHYGAYRLLYWTCMIIFVSGVFQGSTERRYLLPSREEWGRNGSLQTHPWSKSFCYLSQERERERESEGRYIYSLFCWYRLSLLRWRLSVKGTTKRRQLMILSWQRRWRKLRVYYRHCCSSVRETLVGWTKKQDRWVKHFLLPCGV